MTYSDIEDSNTLGSPIYLIRLSTLIVGAGTRRHYTYTNSETPISHEGYIYHYEPVELDDVLRNPVNDDPQVFTMRFRHDLPFTFEFNNQTGTNEIVVKIEKFHTNDPDQEIVNHYVGSVQSLNRDEEFLEINCLEPISLLTSNIHQNFYQILCNHVLYADGCFVDRDSYTTEVTISFVGGYGYELTLSGDFDLTNGYHAGGSLHDPITGDRRRIISQTQSVFIISYPFKALLSGVRFQLSAGCDHSLTTCRDKFNNDRNYGGCNYIPTKEIF